MNKRWIGLGAAAGVMGAVLLTPLRGGWVHVLTAYIMPRLSAASARFAFPVAEPLALLAAGWLLSSRRFKSILRGALSLLLIYVLFWLPLYGYRPYGDPSAPVTAEQLAGIADKMIDEINAQCEQYIGYQYAPADIKIARYPGWLTAIGAAGVYLPWTFEAILNPLEADITKPFTECHERAHRLGIADEGQANIAAYEECARLGGVYRYSAQLSALKYAMTALKALNPEAGAELCAHLTAAARADFARAGGFYESIGRAAALPFTGDYAMLVNYLVASPASLA